MSYTCNRCGATIIFRYSRTDEHGVVHRYRRPFPIHIDGPSCS